MRVNERMLAALTHLCTLWCRRFAFPGRRASNLLPLVRRETGSVLEDEHVKKKKKKVELTKRNLFILTDYRVACHK